MDKEKKPTHKRMTECRKKLYNEEQKQIINKLFEILEFDNNKNSNEFVLYKLENDIDNIKRIEELYDDIKKYFYCGNVNGFTNKNSERPYISVIRCVLRQYGYNIITSSKYIRLKEGNRVKTQFYTVIYDE